MRFWHAVEVVALGLWVGALVGFGALTAPLLFRIVESRQVAGNVAGQVVLGMELAGLACLGLAALALLAQVRAGRGGSGAGVAAGAGAGNAAADAADGSAGAVGAGAWPAGRTDGAGRARRPVGLMLRLLVVVAALVAVMVDLTWVRWGLNLAQAAMERPIEQYAESDPRRVEYNVWHQRSRSASNVYVLLAGSALIWAAAAPARSPRSGGEGG